MTSSIFNKQCSVTSMELRLELTRDGRERGLWVKLADKGKLRREAWDRWRQGAAEELVNVSKGQESRYPNDEEYNIGLAKTIIFTSFGWIPPREVDEAVLLEWPEVAELFNAIGQELEAAKARGETLERLPDEE